MLSASVKYSRYFIFALLICSGPALLFGDVRIGVGAGIQSYPGDLDPSEKNQRIPVVYSQGEINFSLSDRFSFVCVFSHMVITGKLDLYINAPQEIKIYSSGIGGEFDLFRGSGFFGAGLQVQSVLGIYNIGRTGEYDNGFGLKLYGIVRQPVFDNVSAGVRTGIQRVWVRAHAFTINEELILDSFHIDVIVYINL